MMNIYGKKCLLDTNILLFAADRKSPNHARASEIFTQIDENKFQAFISVQNTLEFTAVLTRGYKYHQKKVKDLLDRLLSNPQITLISPSLSAFQIFMRLLQKETGVYVFDLYLAATAISHNLDIIISDDGSFKKIKDIPSYNPFIA